MGDVHDVDLLHAGADQASDGSGDGGAVTGKVVDEIRGEFVRDELRGRGILGGEWIALEANGRSF